MLHCARRVDTTEQVRHNTDGHDDEAAQSGTHWPMTVYDTLRLCMEDR